MCVANRVSKRAHRMSVQWGITETKQLYVAGEGCMALWEQEMQSGCKTPRWANLQWTRRAPWLWKWSSVAGNRKHFWHPSRQFVLDGDLNTSSLCYLFSLLCLEFLRVRALWLCHCVANPSFPRSSEEGCRGGLMAVRCYPCGHTAASSICSYTRQRSQNRPTLTSQLAHKSCLVSEWKSKA